MVNSRFECALRPRSQKAAAAAAAAAKSLQSCPTLCDPIDGSPPGSPVPGILQARTLEWVAIFLLQCMKVKSKSEVAQSCPTLSNPMDCSVPGRSAHGICQARVLEWGAIAFSKPESYPILECPFKNLYSPATSKGLVNLIQCHQKEISASVHAQQNSGNTQIL